MADAGEIKVELVATTGQFNAAMDAAKARIAAMRDPTAAAAAASLRLAQAQGEVKKMTRWLSEDLPHSTANLDRLSRAQVQAALAADQLKTAQAEVSRQAMAAARSVTTEATATTDAARANEAMTAASESAAAASAQVAAGANRAAYGMEYISGYAAASVLGMRQMGFMFGRIGSLSTRTGEILQKMFPIALFALVAEQLGQFVVKMHAWYEQTVLLKGAIQSLGDASDDLAQGVLGAKYAYLQAREEAARLNHDTATQVRLLKQMQALRPASVNMHVTAKQLAPLAGSGIHIAGLAHQIGLQRTAGGLEKLLPAISAAIAKLQHFTPRASGWQAILSGGDIEIGKPPAPGKAMAKAQTQAAALAVTALRKVVTTVGYLEKTAKLKTATAIAEASAEGHRAAHAAHPGRLRSGWGFMVQTTLDAQQQAAEKLKRAADSLHAALAKAAHPATRLRDLTTATFGRVNPGLGAVSNKGFDMGSLLSAMGGGKIEAMNAAMVKSAELAKEVADEQKRLFRGFNEGMMRTVEAVQLGTMNMHMAWRRLGANMVLGIEASWAKIILRDVEGWATKLLIQNTGQAASLASQELAAHRSVLIAAGDAAAHAFSSAMKAYPFPVNIIVGAASAAAAFSETMAVGAFARGGIVPATGTAVLHQHE
ncbi:MAG: hypothetical protein ACRD13_12975, partial [Terriglobales bacterium]